MMMTIPAPAQENHKGRAILDAAMRSFLQDGYSGASMDRIAADAGVSKRTVYNRYKSKEELFAAVVDNLSATILPFDMPEDTLDQPPEVFLKQLSTTVLQVILSPDVLALHRLLSFESSRSPELGRIFLTRGPDRIIDFAKRYLRRQTELGRLAIENDHEAAWQLAGLLKEPLHFHMQFGREPKNLDAEIKGAVDRAVAMFLKLYSACDAPT